MITKIFKLENIETEVKIDQEKNTVWITQSELAKLFNVSRSWIAKQINKTSLDSSTCANLSQVATNGKEYNMKHYSLELILKIGYKIDVDKTLKFKEWVELTLKELRNENEKIPLPIEVFEDGDFKLEVSISPKENTVWLNQEQIAKLFNVARNTISEHINNILNDNELDETCVGFSDTPHLNKVIKIYNLDMIISIGCRVKSRRGIIFRKWAIKILGQYLMRGYAIDESRVTLYKDNYLELNNTVLRLESKVINHEERLVNIENNKKEEIKEKIFFDGEEYDAYSFIVDLIKKANNKIILIDNYIGIKTLDYLAHKKENVQVEIITLHRELTNQAINRFNHQYGNLSIRVNTRFHDRYLIIDDKHLYLIGASIKDAGNKCFGVVKMSEESLNDLLVRV